MDLIQACFKDVVLKDECAWFFDNRIQAICKMNIHNFKVEIVACYEGKKEFNGRKIFCFHNKYYVVEANTVDILIYDEKKAKNPSSFCLQTPPMDCGNMEYEAYGYKGRIYFFPPLMNENIICFDTDLQKYSSFYFDKSISEKTTGKQELQFGYICFYKDMVWLPIRGTSFYGKYSLTERTWEVLQAKDSKAALVGICYDGKNIWMLQEDGGIVCDGKKEVTTSKKQSHTRFYNAKEFIVESPRDVHNLTLICKDNCEEVTVRLPIADAKKGDDQKQSITGGCETDTHVFLFCHGIGDLWILNKKTLEIKGVKLQCKNYRKHCFEHISDEQEDIGIKHLIRFLEEDTRTVVNPREKKNVKVWEHLMGKI